MYVCMYHQSRLSVGRSSKNIKAKPKELKSWNFKTFHFKSYTIEDKIHNRPTILQNITHQIFFLDDACKYNMS